MGILNLIKNNYLQKAGELREYESRGLDLIPDTPEVRSYCIKKVKMQMFSCFLGPLIFALIAWAVAFFILQGMGSGYHSIMDFGMGGRITVLACGVGVPLIAALLFFQHLGSIASGKFELYGGMCLSVQNGEKDHKGNTHYSAKMNGVWLKCESYALKHVGAGVYYYILRVKSGKKAVSFFVKTNPDVASSRTGDVYPND